MNQIATTATIRKEKPPTAPPMMGTREVFDPLCEEVGCAIAETEIEVETSTTVGGGVEVEIAVITVTAPLSSVDEASSVITVGEGVLVTKKVVGMIVGVKDVTDDC